MSVPRDQDDGVTEVPGDVVQRHREWLVRLITSRTRSLAFVEDVLQEVRLAVVRSTRHPRTEDEIAPWLCSIAIRQCALALRGAVRRQRLLDGAAENAATQADDAASRLDDPIYWLLDRERAGLVREALAAMDEEKRKLLVWKHVDGMTYGELAERLGVASHVVEYRVVTARKTLRGLLIERGLGPEDV